jgi:trypsin
MGSRQKRMRFVFAVVGLAVAGLGPSAAAMPLAASAAAPEEVQPMIVGGTEVVPDGKYPFMVTVLPGPYLCGGALIADDWVLTAAHCTEDIDPAEITVWIGRHDLGGSDGEEIGVTAKYEHPDYGIPTVYANDYSLLQLASPSIVGEAIALASPGDAGKYTPGTLATVAGWGDTSWGGTSSMVLLEADVPVVSDGVCAAVYGLSLFDASSMVCAGWDGGGSGTCQGDSGGPLFVDVGGSFLHVGVTSWAHHCAAPGYPTAFAETSAAFAWIAATVGWAPPGAPWGAVTTGASGQVTVWFNPPASDGGSAVSDYVVLFRPQGGGAWTWFPDAVSTAPRITVTGLTNGVPYDFEVAAINAAGLGPWSEVVSGTPVGPAPPAVTFGNGIWVVGSDLPAGRYRMVSDGTYCYWARLSGFGGTLGEIIANDFAYDTQIVDIKATDKGFESSSCNTWSSDLTPRRADPAANWASDGSLVVGDEIAAGTWHNSGLTDYCYWERLRGFGGTLSDIIDNDFTNSPSVVTISTSDSGFYAAPDCGTWTKIG